MAKLSDNQIGDRLHAALDVLGKEEGATIRSNTALIAARQSLALLMNGLLIAEAEGSDHVSTAMSQPPVPPKE